MIVTLEQLEQYIAERKGLLVWTSTKEGFQLVPKKEVLGPKGNQERRNGKKPNSPARL